LSAYDIAEHWDLGHRAFVRFCSAKNEIMLVPSFEIEGWHGAHTAFLPNIDSHRVRHPPNAGFR